MHLGYYSWLEQGRELLTLPNFERLWRTHEVRCRPAPKEYFRSEPWRLRHPVAGALDMHRLAFSVPTALHREIVVYSAADEATFSRLERLAGRSGVGALLRE